MIIAQNTLVHAWIVTSDYGEITDHKLHKSFFWQWRWNMEQAALQRFVLEWCRQHATELNQAFRLSSLKVSACRNLQTFPFPSAVAKFKAPNSVIKMYFIVTIFPTLIFNVLRIQNSNAGISIKTSLRLSRFPISFYAQSSSLGCVAAFGEESQVSFLPSSFRETLKGLPQQFFLRSCLRDNLKN